MEKQKVIFLSSAQASIKDLTSGTATFLLRNPIQFSRSQIGLNEFSFTNWFINISAAIGNNHLYYSDDPANETKYDITIPDGSYSLSALNDYVVAEQASVVGNVIFNIVPNYSTNKAGIQFGNVAGWYVHFGATSPYTLLGFANGQEVPVGKANTNYYIEYGGSTAAFNNITLLKVWCNLTTDSISNTDQSSVIYQTSPTVDVGSTQSSTPHNMLWMDMPIQNISQITVRILDQSDTPVNMSEDFSITLAIRYLE